MRAPAGESQLRCWPPKAQTPINAQAKVLRIKYIAVWREVTFVALRRSKPTVSSVWLNSQEQGTGGEAWINTGVLCAYYYLSYCHYR